VDESGKSIFCFATESPNPGSKGWCETNLTFYDFQPLEEKGWGFCGKDCYLGEYDQRENSNILREVINVDVLPHDLCDLYLEASAKGKQLEVRPQILCVGRFSPWKTQVWKKQGKYYIMFC
jgi:hypothetical protein